MTALRELELANSRMSLYRLHLFAIERLLWVLIRVVNKYEHAVLLDSPILPDTYRTSYKVCSLSQSSRESSM